MRRQAKWMAVVVALAMLWGGVAWAAKPGDAAPELRLPRVGGGTVDLEPLLASGPVVVWFPDSSASPESHAALLRTVSQQGATLLVVPVVGADAVAAASVAVRFPEEIVLHDAQGSVTLAYTGEFIPGVSPRLNLFVVGTRGTLALVRYWPGVSEGSLSNELKAAR